LKGVFAAARDSRRRDSGARCSPWFTEGFDIIDLKDAKALLDELKS
jgi:hypothetical protein